MALSLFTTKDRVAELRDELAALESKQSTLASSRASLLKSAAEGFDKDKSRDFAALGSQTAEVEFRLEAVRAALARAEAEAVETARQGQIATLTAELEKRAAALRPIQTQIVANLRALSDLLARHSRYSVEEDDLRRRVIKLGGEYTPAGRMFEKLMDEARLEMGAGRSVTAVVQFSPEAAPPVKE